MGVNARELLNNLGIHESCRLLKMEVCDRGDFRQSFSPYMIYRLFDVHEFSALVRERKRGYHAEPTERITCIWGLYDEASMAGVLNKYYGFNVKLWEEIWSEAGISGGVFVYREINEIPFTCVPDAFLFRFDNDSVPIEIKSLNNIDENILLRAKLQMQATLMILGKDRGLLVFRRGNSHPEFHSIYAYKPLHDEILHRAYILRRAIKGDISGVEDLFKGELTEDYKKMLNSEVASIQVPKTLISQYIKCLKAYEHYRTLQEKLKRQICAEYANPSSDYIELRCGSEKLILNHIKPKGSCVVSEEDEEKLKEYGIKYRKTNPAPYYKLFHRGGK